MLHSDAAHLSFPMPFSLGHDLLSRAAKNVSSSTTPMNLPIIPVFLNSGISSIVDFSVSNIEEGGLMVAVDVVLTHPPDYHPHQRGAEICQVDNQT